MGPQDQESDPYGPTGSGSQEKVKAVEIRYTLTLEDYSAGNQLLQLQTTLRRRITYYLFARFGLAIGIPIFCAAIILFFVNLLSPSHRFGAATSGLTAAVAWVGAVCIMSPYIYRRKVARYFREHQLPVERILTANDSGVSIARTDGAAETRTNWSMFDKSVESSNLFTLFPNLRQFVPIPKRAMTPEQQQEFRALVAAHVQDRSDRWTRQSRGKPPL
jgi:YcxB-like protein